jgi:D-alanine-D-alanine ligase-like ATP-grasp enzyme
MGERGISQYFGPSPRHARACVELRFAIGADSYRLAPVEPVLLEAGFKLREVLPDEPLPLDAAVARLAVAMLARHGQWWSSHGRDETQGWAAIGHPYPHIAAAALDCAVHLLDNGGVPPAGARAKMRELSQWLEHVSKIKLWMLFAAGLHDHDTTTVNEAADLHQVGQGAKGVHMCRSGSQRDGLTSTRLESNKQLTVELLRKLGLPTTSGAIACSASEAVTVARKLGLPCVVKPLSLSRGTGVAAGLASDAAVKEAASAALTLSRQPIRVEKHVEGDAHRLLVAAGELLWVYRKRAARVTGDGKTSVVALIERENARRSRTRNRAEAHLVKIDPTEGLRRYVKDRHGLGLDDILPKGRTIEVSGEANTASGGTLEDMMTVTHPDNRALALRAARLFRFEVMGIDFMTPDIARSWKDVPCAIIEVNRMPSMNALGDATLVQRTLFPNRLSGSIPMLAVVGDAAYREARCDDLRAAFAGHGLRLATADYSTSRSAPPGAVIRIPSPLTVEALLLDPEADAGAILCDPERVEREGLPLQRCDLLIRQDKTPLPWLDTLAETVLRGPVSPARIELVVARLARRYGDPTEGGPLPVLEPLDAAPDEFRLKVWRSRGMPRAWFWRELGVEGHHTDGMTTHADLLEAVLALTPGMAGAFTHDEVAGGWAHVTFDATVALPKQRREDTRALLLAAVERVNRIAAAPIGEPGAKR